MVDSVCERLKGLQSLMVRGGDVSISRRETVALVLSPESERLLQEHFWTKTFWASHVRKPSGLGNERGGPELIAFSEDRPTGLKITA